MPVLTDSSNGDFEGLLSNENSTTFHQRNLQKANDWDI